MLRDSHIGPRADPVMVSPARSSGGLSARKEHHPQVRGDNGVEFTSLAKLFVSCFLVLRMSLAAVFHLDALCDSEF